MRYSAWYDGEADISQQALAGVVGKSEQRIRECLHELADTLPPFKIRRRGQGPVAAPPWLDAQDLPAGAHGLVYSPLLRIDPRHLPEHTQTGKPHRVGTL